MKSLSPVVWSEGMYLGPHQFQAQNRYFEDSIEFATSALWFENYGLIGAELSGEALENGQVQVVHARGIFPDGLVFDMPDSDPLPRARDLSDAFPPTSNRLIAYLAVPEMHADRRNFALENGSERPVEGVRFVAEALPLHDETTGRDERPIRVGRKNIRIVFETEDTLGLVRLPLARIARSPKGGYMLDPMFIPPSLDISATPKLMQTLGSLVGVLQDRSSSLALAKGEQPAFSVAELTRFWLLHTINSALVPLRHLYVSRRGHPEQLFLELSRLAGALCTFSLESHPRSLPVYNHEALGDCFDALDMHIRRHLEIIIPTSCLKIPLTPGERYFYSGDVTDQRCFGHTTWVLAMRGGGGEVDVISKVPVLVKVCSEAFVPELVRRALPGFAMTHVAHPPTAISARPGTQYFLLNTAGPCWDHIRKTRRVGVYIPGDLPDPEAELLVIIEPS